MTRSKIPPEVVIETYKRTGSIWTTASELGLCGQTVHERLVKLGALNKKNYITEENKDLIREVYTTGFVRGDGILDDLVRKTGLNKQVISRWAKTEGLTSRERKIDKSLCASMGERTARYIEESGHPRGFLGRKHTDEAKKKISRRSRSSYASMSDEKKHSRVVKAMKTRVDRYGSVAGTWRRCSWKSGWREIGGKRSYYRSRWEANYARILECMKCRGEISLWEHEPETFWFEGVDHGSVSYLPDFRVTCNNGGVYYVEVKGWMCESSKMRIARMAEYHPDIKLVVVDAKAYRKIEKEVSTGIPGWEYSK